MAAWELTALLRMLPDAAQRAVAAHQQEQLLRQPWGQGCRWLLRRRRLWDAGQAWLLARAHHLACLLLACRASSVSPMPAHAWEACTRLN